tara:strand:- start:98 stop:298 length:201 start_codon:yes stop_codon:yes gene_type:complete
MAVQITLDFTDGQWELIKDFYNLAVPLTQEEFTQQLGKDIAKHVEDNIMEDGLRKAQRASKNAFDV